MAATAEELSAQADLLTETIAFFNIDTIQQSAAQRGGGSLTQKIAITHDE